MNNMFKLDESVTDEDRIAMAQAYRAYELLTKEDKLKIPKTFVDTLLDFGNFKEVKPFKDKSEMTISDLSTKAKYLLMYMCTFNKI